MSIHLQKDQKISLSPQAGGSLNQIIMGLGWGVKRSGESLINGLFGGGVSKFIDLDASCVLFNAQNKAVDLIWFRQLKSRDGSVIHTGDNRTGEGESEGGDDDEQIIVNLHQVPSNVEALVFTVSSFTNETFENVDNAYFRLVNGVTQKEIARYTISCKGFHTAQVMAKVYRHNKEWMLQAIGENTHGRTIESFLPQIIAYL